MTTTTKTRTKKPAPKARTLSYDAQTCHLTIKVGDEASGYWVDLVAVVDGGLQFELLKDRATRKAGEVTSYATCVSAGSEEKFCECKGFEFRQRCRHVDALAVLLERGHFQAR